MKSKLPSKAKGYPKLKDLYGIKVVVSNHIPDHIVVLVGDEKYSDDPLRFTRKISVMNLKTGTVSGSVHKGEVQVIHVSKRNKDLLSEVSNE